MMFLVIFFNSCVTGIFSTLHRRSLSCGVYRTPTAFVGFVVICCPDPFPKRQNLPLPPTGAQGTMLHALLRHKQRQVRQLYRDVCAAVTTEGPGSCPVLHGMVKDGRLSFDAFRWSYMTFWCASR